MDENSDIYLDFTMRHSTLVLPSVLLLMDLL